MIADDGRAPDRLYHDSALAQFYDIDNAGGRVDFAYCRKLAADASSILDIGCGTGELAARIAATGKRVCGVDPAAAMLEIARHRPDGHLVHWIEADARDFNAGQLFDLVIMTGHAFQCFLSRDDRLAALKSIAVHLEPDGTFTFDTRNPAAAEWLEWTPDQSGRMFSDASGEVEAWNDATFDPTTYIATYETHYRRADGTALSATSRIAFPERQELETLIAEAGLAVTRWLGDWHGRAWSADAPEIIPVGRLA